MSSFIEKIFGALFGLLNGYENMRARRNDDPLTAEYKRLKRACVASVLYAVGAVVLSFAVGGVFSTLDGNATLGQLADGFRAPIGNALLVALGATSLYLVYCWTVLYLFIRKYDLGQ